MRELPVLVPYVWSPLDLIQEKCRRRIGGGVEGRWLGGESGDAVGQIPRRAIPGWSRCRRHLEPPTEIVEVLLVGTNDAIAIQIDARCWIRGKERGANHEVCAGNGKTQVDFVRTQRPRSLIDIDDQVRAAAHRHGDFLEQV